jgi:regulator of replication initiation timing
MSSNSPYTALPLSLPIATSSAGLQSAQIASLTTQIEQLVRKNEALTRQYENDKRQLEMTIESEQKRARDAVSKMMEASKSEVAEWEANCEKVCICFSLVPAELRL